MQLLIVFLLFLWAIFGAVLFINVIDSITSDTKKADFKIFLLAVFAGPMIWLLYMCGFGFYLAEKFKGSIVNWVNK